MKNYTPLWITVLLILVFITAADNYGGWNGQPMFGDDIGGINVPAMKLMEGADGTNDGYISSANPLPVVDSTSTSINTSVQSSDRLAIAREQISALEDVNVFGQTINADATNTDVWSGSVDTAVYVAPTQARVHNITSSDALDVLSAGTLTFALDAGDGDTVTMASKVYTFQLSLTDVDGNVLIDGVAGNTIDNLIAAINLGAGAGAKYATSTTANVAPTSAAAGAGDTMTMYAETAIATTDDNASMSWGGANAVLGTGAKTVIIRGLVGWGTTESAETLNMTGVTASPTTNSYVFINSMEVVTSGGTTINAGIIKATAVSDASVSAYIPIGDGESHAGLLGVPSIETFYLDQLHFTVLGAGTTDIVDFSLLVNTEPDAQLTQFKEKFATGFVGTAMQVVPFNTPLVFAGPCIVKLRALSDTADSHVGARLGGVLETN